MKLTLSVFGLLLLLLTSSCKYEVQFEGPYSDDDVKPLPTYTGLIWIEGGKLYIAHNDLSNIRQIPGPANILRASINYAHDRIAYQVANSDIVIVDTLGTEIEKVPNSKTVKSFDWHGNDITLYMLDNLTLRLHGPSVALDATNMGLGFMDAKPGSIVIFSVAVNEAGRLIHTYQYTEQSTNIVRYGYALQQGSGKTFFDNTYQYTNVRMVKQVFDSENGSYSNHFLLSSNLGLVAIGTFPDIYHEYYMRNAAISSDSRYYAGYEDGKMEIYYLYSKIATGASYTPSQPITSIDW